MLKVVYDQIKSKLEIKITKKKEKIEVLDELRNSKKPATAEQYRVLSEREEPLSSEEIALILETKSTIDYQPVLIDHTYNFYALQSAIEGKLKIGEPFHYDFILKEYRTERSGCIKLHHCNPVKVDFDGHKVKIFFIESTVEPYQYDEALFSSDNFGKLIDLVDLIQTILDESKVKLYGHAVKKQHDAFSCPIFAIQDLMAMSAIGVESLDQCLPLELDEDPPQSLDLARLHPRFLKSCQSQQPIVKNLTNQENGTVSVSSKKQKPLNDYIKEHLIAIEVFDNKLGKNVIKYQNRAIDYQGFKYITKALQRLEDIYQQGGNELLEQRMDARLLGLLSNCSQFANADAGISGAVTDETSLTAAVRNLSLARS